MPFQMIHGSSTDACCPWGHACSSTTEQSRRTLVAKHFNVMDPLLPHNNLGRSVSQSNLIRIRTAFAHGAAKLHKALRLSDPADAVAEVCAACPPTSSLPIPLLAALERLRARRHHTTGARSAAELCGSVCHAA